MTAPTTVRTPWGLYYAVFAAAFISLIDVSIVWVALPTVQAELGADVAGAQWVVDAYTVALAAFLLSGGSLGDRYGRKRVFLCGLSGFVLGSAVCAFAPTVGVLLVGRAVQGVAAAVMLPGTLAILGRSEADPARRARLFGYWGVSASAAVLAGPILGGVLVEAFGWSSIFLINLPVGLVAVVVGLRAVPESADPEHTSLDPVGQVLGVAALGLTTFAVIEGRWGEAVTLVPLGAGVAAAVAFVLVERRLRAPMLPVRLLGQGRFGRVVASAALFCLGANGSYLLVSLYYQHAEGRSALTTGLMMIPMTASVLPMSYVAGRLLGRHGPWVPMRLGCLVTSLGLFGLVLAPGVSYWAMVPLFVLVGAGYGLAATPAAAAVISAVPAHRVGVASGTLNAARQAGTAVGIAVQGSILTAGYAAGTRWGMAFSGVAVLAAAVVVSTGRATDDHPGWTSRV